MTTEEFVQMLRELQEITERIRGTPFSEEEIARMAEEHRRLKAGKSPQNKEG